MLSFVLESSNGCLEGEVIVSADRAAAVAPKYGWSAADELLLYVIHGTLHLVGYDDVTPAKRAAMPEKSGNTSAGCCLVKPEWIGTDVRSWVFGLRSYMRRRPKAKDPRPTWSPSCRLRLTSYLGFRCSMSSEKASAIVIRAVEFSETSLVVTLFTREFGKLGALAKGARRLKGPFESALDLLALFE